MPRRTKKLLVYLDQNFISELAKADINNKVKQEWKYLYRLLPLLTSRREISLLESRFYGLGLSSNVPHLKNRPANLASNRQFVCLPLANRPNS